MTVYVALLRAIGPATHGKLSMAALRKGCEDAGFTDVSTYVATGNVIFASDKNAEGVRKAVQAVVDDHGLGATCDVFVRTRRQLAALAKANPFTEAAGDHPQSVGVCFFQKAPTWPSWVRHHDGTEKIAAITSHLVIDYGKGISSSKLKIEHDTKARMTQRNWNTVLGLLKKTGAVSG